MAITIDLEGTPAGGTSSSAVISFGGTVGSGNGAVVQLKSASRGASSMVDDQGNSFTKIKEVSFFGALFSSIWSSPDSSGATSVTLTFASSTSFIAQATSVVGNLTAHANNGTAGNSASQQPGSINTSVADTIVFALTNTSNSPTTPAGFTNTYGDGTTNFCHRILTATVSGFNPAFTVGTSSPFASVQVAFTSSNTTGAINANLSDLLLFSDLFVGEKQDVLFWVDAFTYAPPVDVTIAMADTLTFSDTMIDEQNLSDSITWSSSTFLLVEFFGRVDDELSWTDEFSADINLLSSARYRR